MVSITIGEYANTPTMLCGYAATLPAISQIDQAARANIDIRGCEMMFDVRFKDIFVVLMKAKTRLVFE